MQLKRVSDCLSNSGRNANVSVSEIAQDRHKVWVVEAEVLLVTGMACVVLDKVDLVAGIAAGDECSLFGFAARIVFRD